jgi:hypothetical protein
MEISAILFPSQFPIATLRYAYPPIAERYALRRPPLEITGVATLLAIRRWSASQNAIPVIEAVSD